MRSLVEVKGTIIYGLVILVLVLGAIAATPLFSRAAMLEARVVAAPSEMTLTIVNNSNREIRHLYFSPTAQDNWGPDQLNSSTIVPGGSFTVNNVSCSASGTKAIAEDQNGCFVYQVLVCGDNASWTITNDTAPDCGN